MTFEHLQYMPCNGAICTTNGLKIKNRPLYMKDGLVDLVYTGDKAEVYCPSGEVFRIGFIQNALSKWADLFENCRMEYRPNRTKWIISDRLFDDAVFEIELLPAHEGYGFTAAVKTSGSGKKLSLVILFCDETNEGEYKFNVGTTVKVQYNSGLSPVDLSATAGNDAWCRIDMEAGKQYFASIQLKPKIKNLPLFHVMEDKSCEVLYSLAKTRCEELDKKITVHTPNEYFNTAVPFAASALDSTYIADPPVFHHGGEGWRMPFLGWRTMPGFILLGWHEKVKTSIRYYLSLQNKEHTTSRDAVTTLEDPIRMSRQSLDSRFYGKGYIPHVPYYNMQTQFFDAAIDEWRATGDPKFEEELLICLELHLERSKECFDPDDDGLYESYVNVLPTDSMQYNGGSTIEESCYIYRARMAAAEMCARKGDLDSRQRHLAEAQKIKNALNTILYLKEDGYYASWREQSEPFRIHKDAWLYSEFLPIHHEIAEGHKAVSALYYTEWSLERVKLPCGGEMCWNSNWLPQKWSTRWFYGADNYSLAEAYFITGLSDEGWELIKGNILQSNYCLKGAEDALAPGGFSYGNGEENAPCVDAADITNAFVPAVVYGMFGYRPDYPNGKVLISPSFPSDWTHAEFNIPDFGLSYKQDGAIERYDIRLKKSAKISFCLQVCAESVRGLRINGKAADYLVTPWYGCVRVIFESDICTSALVEMEVSGRFAAPQMQVHSLEIDDIMEINGHASDDPQNCLKTVEEHNGKIKATAGKAGHFVVFAKVKVGQLEMYQIHRLHISDTKADRERAYQTPQAALGGRQSHIDLSGDYNGDIEQIFKQKYLSPRPNTVSTRISCDGYSNWTYLAWGKLPPEICFDLPQDRMIQTDTGVSFGCGGSDRNIIFTSVWDNWPTKAAVRINKSADAAWLLICGSTNCMQGKIENARLEFIYTDKTKETLSLIHPENFWTLAPTCEVDYDYEKAGWPLPKTPPPQVQLGRNCRAMVLSMRLDRRKVLESISLECISEDVIVGIMGITLEDM